jgi:hypothetical protein
MMKCDFIVPIVAKRIAHHLCNESAEKYFIGVYNGVKMPSWIVGVCAAHHKPFLEEIFKTRLTDIVLYTEILYDEVVTFQVMDG